MSLEDFDRNEICTNCEEFQARFFTDDGSSLCIECKLKIVREENQQLRADIDLLLQTQEMTGLIGRCYCDICGEKIKDMDLGDRAYYENILLKLQDKGIKAKFQKILEKHLKEKI